MTARRWGALTTATLAAAVLAVVLWPGSPVPASHVGAASVSAKPLCAGARRRRCGELIVTSRNTGGLPSEGAIVTVILAMAHHRIAPQRMRAGVGRVSARLPSGRVTLDSVLHICDANCGHLDPPVRCAAASARIDPRRITTATVLIEGPIRCRVAVGREPHAPRARGD